MSKIDPKAIAAKLEDVYLNSPIERIDVEQARIIIFSDQHKGQGDGADDFVGCKRAYHAALGHYFEQQHRLIVLGDVEELWECRPSAVVRHYAETLALEKRFHAENRYTRFWGNHDDEWRESASVAEYLGPIFGTLRVLEGLRLEVTRGAEAIGTLFLVHGHQGTFDSDRFGKLSRLFVRLIWRNIQRITRWRINTPATSFELREAHDRAMYDWAASHDKLVLVAGHTHRPVFTSRTHAQSILEQMEALEREPTDDESRRVERLAALQAELEWARAGNGGGTIPGVKPCYFNSGCCCFDDGDVTGLEIIQGHIRLVRWPDDEGRPRPKILASADLAEVFRRN